MERINIRERRSQAKIAGTLITVGGALLMILFSGPVVSFPWTKHSAGHAIADSASHSSGRWLMGIFMILLSCFCWSAFFILQVKSRSFLAFCFSCISIASLQLRRYIL
jgi:drug/metabolite transporter (DMT)-like permease